MKDWFAPSGCGRRCSSSLAAWGYPVVLAIFVLGALAFVTNTLFERPVESLAGLGLLALGLPVYWYWRR